jgi:hypothetical protein
VYPAAMGVLIWAERAASRIGRSRN